MQDIKYRQFQAHENTYISSFSIIENSNFILTAGGRDSTIRLHSLTEDASTSIIVREAPQNKNYSIVDSSDMCIGSMDDKIEIFDLAKTTPVRILDNTPNDPTHNRTNFVIDAKILNKNMLVTCGNNHTMNMFDIRMNVVHGTNGPFTSIALGERSLYSIGYHGYNICCSGEDGRIYTMDLRNSEVICDQVSNYPILKIHQYPNDLTLSFDLYGQVRLFNNRSGLTSCSYNINEPVRRLTHTFDLQMIPERNCIINSTNIGEIQFYSVNKDRTQVRKRTTLKAVVDQNQISTNYLNGMKFDPVENRVIASGGTGIIHVWDNVFG
ncbi:uncharacterized protein J8A68_005857 [[Candida] subhashii]|uniref:Uncharacterized protein n=1 Tax=[Candida] subhashii TaxID=561895 RepID=A0A8J5Q532_9ASCO|nr:uncharacterized protein J8A68_005857 [[Candida] subhashii]KAG7660591.1 hypothetical protein J8A68_005857 [[Candida] subhashii]